MSSITVHHNNPSYTSVNGVLFNKDKTTLIQYPAGRHGDFPTDLYEGYYIPETVVKIGEGAFAYCENLIFIAMPDSLTEIGEYAFFHCTGLTTLIMPDSVPEIGDKAFAEGVGLTIIIIK